MSISPLQKIRYQYMPKLPPALSGDISKITIEIGQPTQSFADQDEVKKLFPCSYGAPIVHIMKDTNKNITNKKLTLVVVLSGGQAPGGHNVIAGLFDVLKQSHKDSRLLGAQGGPKGLIDGRLVEITASLLENYRNTGGFDIIGSGRDKIEKLEDLEKVAHTCQSNGIDGVVIVGGDDSNTNAAVLAEYFQALHLPIGVVGCPKTIDGDLKNEYIETSFGFDTACKTYSEIIGNIARDANSAKKYWHFIKLMGRSASHIALECALQTQPNICLIGEEVAAQKMTLDQLVEHVAQIIAKRAENHQNFGVVLIPEGLIEFIPDVGQLIYQLSHILSTDGENAKDFEKQASLDAQMTWLQKHLTKENFCVFQSLPAQIRRQLLLDRDSHGNVQVSLIETEKLMIEMVKAKLRTWANQGKYRGRFSALSHFLGYEGRCAFPSNFDADYCYSLGFNAFVLLHSGFTGYLSTIKNTHQSADHWVCVGVPITMMMNIEHRHGKPKPVIKKALVDLQGKPFQEFAAHRDQWAIDTDYLFPGAIQYFGPPEVCDLSTKTLLLEQA